ncbi:MAG TPA: glycoside hydrolase family 3 N-terminal domain-containing protein [Bacteroidales bacterium]|nr:glycoside hydrolase family 3 N-terminal domain-containing protein [Bacteroidales bacterium]
MKRTTYKLVPVFLAVIALAMSACGRKWNEEQKTGFTLVHNKGGQVLGYSPASGVKIITVEGFAFKDLNKNGKLDPYEDWRLPADKRAKDLASRMTVEQIAGLMLYSSHQAIPSTGGSFMGSATYGGKPFKESGSKSSDLSDQQKKFLSEDNLRHVLITTVESPDVAATWNNNAQALVEGLGLGIPINISSDPRHGTDVSAEFNAGSGGKISMWPGSLGIAASFDPGLMKKFGKIAAIEYRALGIATSLSPQIDLGTEPRWGRFNGTMGDDPDLTTDMARAYVDGFQTSDSSHMIAGGWGYRSVNTMVKHWPGGGPEEGGRDGHFGYGAYAVYPGSNLKDHLKSFTEGAFRLEGPTGTAAAVMPYYTISYNIDTKNNENVGNSYNKYIITDLLRGEYKFDGVVCTDWGVTWDVTGIDKFEGKCWGVEKLSVPERHYKILMAGVDQFGGNNDKAPVLEAYKIGVKEHGEEFMRIRFEESAVRLLRNIIRVGLLENPYLDPAESKNTVGNAEFMRAGYEAQLKSVVMLKNEGNVLPLEKQLKVYMPKRYTPAASNWFGMKSPEKWSDAMNPDVVGKYFTLVDKPEQADFALVAIESPHTVTGYSQDDVKKGGNGYVPISLQYGKYTATYARVRSIAGGSPLEKITDRSFRGKSTEVSNSFDMKMVNETKARMGKKPVIVVVNVMNPMVFSEIEKSSSAILVHFGVQNQAIMDLITGAAEPSALLPFQMPANMKTVEEQMEDVPHDMFCYKDADGHAYDFGFGLNWKGVINDARVTRYSKK